MVVLRFSNAARSILAVRNVPDIFSSPIFFLRVADELDKINEISFPYQPHVAIRLKRADPELAKGIDGSMRREHPESVEWLDSVADSLKPEEWQALRKRKGETK